MNNFIIILIILSATFIGYHYIQFLKATRGTAGFAQRRAISRLFLGFMALIGITNIFAEVLFEFLQLKKPLYFELLAFVAYIVFAIITFLIIV